MAKILVPIANGFEEIEAISVIDICRRAGIEVVTAGVEDKVLIGAHNIKIEMDKKIDEVKSRYAVVGTYSISNKSLNLFIKLIDINSGNILSSSFARTDLDSEILDLEGISQNRDMEFRNSIRRPMVL